MIFEGNQKPVAQIVSSNGLYFKVICKIVKDTKNPDENIFHLQGRCLSDPTILLKDEELQMHLLVNLLKLMVVKDVLPNKNPFKNVTTFEDFCRFFVFPFIQIGDPDEEENIPENTKIIEMWGRAPGFLDSETYITFLGQACYVALNYMHDYTVRMAITALDKYVFSRSNKLVKTRQVFIWT